MARHGFVAEESGWDWKLKGSPFPGLAAFDAGRADVFFGRDLEAAHAIDRLKAANARGAPFLLLIGASGSGKSSLLRAAILPRLVLPGAVPEIDSWRTGCVIPGQNPLLSLAEALFADGALGPELREGEFPTKETLAELLCADVQAGLTPIGVALGRAAKARAAAYNFSDLRPCRLALGVDQAERLFLEAEPKLAAAFAKVIEALVVHELAFVLMTMRSDAYAPFQLVPEFRNLSAKGASLDVVPPDSTELEETIVKPVAACKPPLVFETKDGLSLAAVLVAEVEGGNRLPLLQMALSRLFDAQVKRGDGVLRFADYPGLDVAVTQAAEEVLSTLDQAAQSEVPGMIAAMISDVVSDPVTRKLAPVVTALQRDRFEKNRPARTSLVDAFVIGRLLSIEGEEDDVRVRPTHDALLRIWPEAVKIVHGIAPLIRVRHMLEPIVREWAAAGDDKSEYTSLSPALTSGAQRLLATFGDDLSPQMRDFISAALKVDEARRAETVEEGAIKERVKTAELLAKADQRLVRFAAFGLVIAAALAGLIYWDELRIRSELQVVTKYTNDLLSGSAQSFRKSAGVPVGLIKDVLDPIRNLQDKLLSLGIDSEDLQNGRAAALEETATTWSKVGNSDSALQDAQSSRDILERLRKSDPKHTDWAERMLADNVKIGDVQKIHGNLDLALDTFRKSLSDVEASSKQAPESHQWLHWLSLHENKIGDALFAQGKFDSAREAYEQGLAYALLEAGEPTAQRDTAQSHANCSDALPEMRELGDPTARRDIAHSYERCGSSLLHEGKFEGALAKYAQSRDIRQSLSDSDPQNAVASQELASSHICLGDVHLAQRDPDGAYGEYQKAFAIAQPLANEDKDNAEWQHSVAVSYEKIADAEEARHNIQQAAAAYRNSLAILEGLAAKDRANVDWQLDLADAQRKVALIDPY
ncbi:MAG: hypothetical protein ABSC25_06270 [Roseiarcus sp.]